MRTSLILLLLSVASELAVAFQFQPRVEDFATTAELTGIFTFQDGGRSMSSSQIDGRPIYQTGTLLGGGKGLSARSGVPGGIRVTAAIAYIRTLRGQVPVAMRISSGTQVFYSRTPEDALDLWNFSNRSMVLIVVALTAAAFAFIYIKTTA